MSLRSKASFAVFITAAFALSGLLGPYQPAGSHAGPVVAGGEGGDGGNGDGTATAVWDFGEEGDYTLMDTSISGEDGGKRVNLTTSTPRVVHTDDTQWENGSYDQPFLGKAPYDRLTSTYTVTVTDFHADAIPDGDFNGLLQDIDNSSFPNDWKFKDNNVATTEEVQDLNVPPNNALGLNFTFPHVVVPGLITQIEILFAGYYLQGGGSSEQIEVYIYNWTAGAYEGPMPVAMPGGTVSKRYDNVIPNAAVPVQPPFLSQHYIDPAGGGPGFPNRIDIKLQDDIRTSADSVATGDKGMLYLDQLMLKVTHIQYDDEVNYVSEPIDAGSGAVWDLVKWDQYLETGTDLEIYTRTGDTEAGVNSADWDGPYSAPPAQQAEPSGTGRYMQYRVNFGTTDPHHTAQLREIVFRYTQHVEEGRVETDDFSPDHGFLYLNDLSYEASLRGGEFIFNYSIDNGTTWSTVGGWTGGIARLGIGPLVGAGSISSIRIRVTIRTMDTLVTPLLHNLKLNYTFNDDPTVISWITGYAHGAPFAGPGLGYDTVPELEAGDILVFKVAAVNGGNGTATNLSVWLEMDTDLEYGSDTSDVDYERAGTAGGTGLFWNHTGIPETEPANEIGFSISLRVRAGRPNGTPINVTFHVDTQNSLNRWNRVEKGTFRAVVAAPVMDLSTVIPEQPAVTSNGSQKTVQVGASFTYHISYDNAGGGGATRVKVVDPLPEGMEFVDSDVPIDRAASDLEAGNITWTVGGVAEDNGTAVIVVTVAVTDERWAYSNLVNTPYLTYMDNGSHAFAPIFAPSESIEALPLSSVGPNILEDKIPPQRKPEDSPTWNLDLLELDCVIDLDAKTLPYEMSWYMEVFDGTLYSVAGNGGTVLAFTPVPNANGVDEAVLTVYDGDGHSDSVRITVEITPVNDPPEIAPFDPVMVHYDEPHEVPFYDHVTDVDTPWEALGVEVDDKFPAGEYATYEKGSDSAVLVLNYPYTFNGQRLDLELVVTDEESRANTTLRVSVTDNHPPKFTPLQNQLITEEEIRRDVVDLRDHVVDEDHPDGPFVFTAGGYDPDNLEVQFTGENLSSVTLVGKAQRNAVERVTFTVADPLGATASTIMLVEIIATNDRPILAPIPPMYVPTTELLLLKGLPAHTFNLFPYVSDDDNTTDELRFQLGGSLMEGNPTYARVESAQVGMIPLRFTLPPGEKGNNYTLRLTVTDGMGSDFIDIQVMVIDYLPPMITGPIPDVVMNEDSPLTGALDMKEYVDFQGELVFMAFTMSSLTHPLDQWVDVSINETGRLDVATYFNHSNGEELVILRALALSGAFAESTVKLEVVPVNDPPVILAEGFAGLNVTEGSAKTLRWDNWTYDPDMNRSIPQVDTGQKLEARTDSTSFFIVSSYLLLEGPEDGAGLHTFNLTVSDGVADTTLELTVTVNPPPDPGGGGETPNLLGIIASYMLLFLVIVILGILVYYVITTRYSVNEIFLIHKKGNLIAHATAKRQSAVDEEILSGMFTAVQDFIKDSFTERTPDGESGGGGGEAFALDELKLGEQNILLEREANTFIAVIFEGSPRRLRRRTKKVLREIEDRYGEVLDDWDGNMTPLEGTQGHIETLLTMKEGNGDGGEEDTGGLAPGESIEKFLMGAEDGEGPPGDTVVDGDELLVPADEAGLPPSPGHSPMEMLRAAQASEAAGIAGGPPSGLPPEEAAALGAGSPPPGGPPAAAPAAPPAEASDSTPAATTVVPPAGASLAPPAAASPAAPGAPGAGALPRGDLAALPPAPPAAAAAAEPEPAGEPPSSPAAAPLADPASPPAGAPPTAPPAGPPATPPTTTPAVAPPAAPPPAPGPPGAPPSADTPPGPHSSVDPPPGFLLTPDGGPGVPGTCFLCQSPLDDARPGVGCPYCGQVQK